MSIINDLKQLCSVHSCGGQKDIVDVASELLRPYVDEIMTDSMGNLIAKRHAEQRDAKTIMLEAHMDEIGFLVTDVDDLGFVHVAACGGVDKRVLAAQPVVIYGKKVYRGVFGSTPPHLSKGDDALQDVSDIGIDVGMDAKTAREQIPLGSRVGFASRFLQLNDKVVSSKGLDNRSGMAAVLHCLRQLSDRRVNVVVSFCVQEELGCRGAAVAARQIQPNFALVTDVSFALTHDSDPRMCGKLHNGVMIGISPILNKAMSETLSQIADEADIPHQSEVMAAETGTNADEISRACFGIPTALLSIPLRYMHTPVEVVNIDDIASTGDLMARFIEAEGR